MKKALLLAALLLALPAYAQRGSTTHPLSNYAETCDVYGTVSQGVSCAGYPKQWCVNYSTSIIYACDPTSQLWEEVGSAAGGGGGTTISVRSDGATTFSGVDLIDFLSEFSVSDLGSGDVSISINDSTLAPNMGNATGVLSIATGGTGSTTAAAARSALGAAGSGSNNDITALTGLTTAISESQGGTGRNADTYMTDDDFLLYDSTSGTFINVDIPACLDSGGNHLNYNSTSNTLSCGNTGSGGGGSGYATIQNAGTGLTVRTVFNVATSGSGSALAAADDAGNTRTNITLTTTPTAATSVVGSARALTGGAGIGALGDLSADRTVATASQEAVFLADGGATSLTCTSTQGAGSMQVMDAGTLQWCDGAATPALRTGAFGDSSGRSLTGDDANNFFATGVLNVANGGTGAAALGSDTQVLFNNGNVVGADAGMTYVAGTDTLTVGTLVTSGGADGTWGDTFRENTLEPSPPSGGFQFLYSLNNNLYNKDDDDSTNERLMLDSENVTGGDFTVSSSGVGAIGADKITEVMLKVTDIPADEECLSYESTVGDFEWQACGSGGGGGNVAADAIWDVKGDLAVGTGADTAARLAVGANGFALVADSAQSTGVKWQSAVLTEETTPAAGHILVYDGTDSYDNKAVSGDLASISSAGAVVIADNAVDGTDIALASNVAGDVMYYDGTDWVRLAKGTDGEVLELVAGIPSWELDDGAGGGAPTTLDYLVGTATASLSAEIVVGTSPGGELGGSWSSPTIDDTVTVAGWTLTTATITDPTLTIQNSGTPTPTVEGDIWWEDDDDHIIVGDGGATQVEFVPAEDVSGDILMTDAGVVTIQANTVALSTDTTGNYVLDVADGTGIDGTAAAEGATYTPTLDLTEINSTTFGSGTFTTLTFDAGATDPVFTMASNSVIVTNAATFNHVDDSIPTADLATERRSMYWGAGAFSTDGTQCAAPAEVTINSGPKLYTVICTDNDAATIYGSTAMPDSWDGGNTLTFALTYVQTAADTAVLNSDIAAQCRSNGEAPSSTWGTEVAIDDAAVVGSNSNDITVSGNVTPAGTACATGDMLYWRWQLDATGTTTAVATLHIVGVKMEFVSNVGD